MAKKTFSMLLGICLIAFLVWIVYHGYLSFSEAFSGASDTIKAASIAAMVSVVTLLAGRYFEQERERKSRANAEKIKLYERVFNFYFLAMGNETVAEKPDDPDWIAKELFQIQKELVFWAPDSVMRAYIDFRKALADASVGHLKDEDLPRFLAPKISAAALLLKRMRQDVGYTFTSFSAADLALFQLKTDDPHFEALIAELTR